MSAQREAAFSAKRMDAIGHLRSSVRIIRVEETYAPADSPQPYDWQKEDPELLIDPVTDAPKPEPARCALTGNMLLRLTALPEMLRQA